MSIKILLVEDHIIVRDGLRTLIEKQSDMEVIGEAGDGKTAIQMTQELKPHVVIIDIVMPDLNGIDATRRIIEKVPEVKVIALSMHSHRRFIVEMLKAGASGYLLKECAFEELAEAIRTVVKNRIYLKGKLAELVIKDYIRLFPEAEFSAFSSLTSREREVLQLLAEGKTTKHIASQLNRSVKTIETTRQQIMKNLNLHSIPELTRYAIQEGLTSLEISLKN